VAQALGLVAVGTVVLLECARVLFSVGYATGEDLGWIVAGLAVVALFSAGLIAAPLQRVLGARDVLLVAVGGVVVLRLGIQAVDPIPLWLALAGTGAGLVTLTLGLAALRSSFDDGSVLAILAVGGGVAIDVAVRATDATWDIPWRRDGWAWGITLLLAAVLVASALGCRRSGVVPADEDRGGPLVALLVWPYLYFVVVYLQSPAHLDAVLGVPVATGVAVAALNALVGIGIVLLVSRHGLPRPARVIGGLALAACGFVLPAATGAAALALALVTQVIAAGVLGAVAGAERDERRPGIALTALASAAGGVAFATATMLFVLHTIQPLPVTNQVVPALLGALTVLSVRARPTPPTRTAAGDAASTPTAGRVVSGPVAAALVGAVGALSLAAVLGLALTAPSIDRDAVAAATPDGARTLAVMSFNIDQGVTEGQLDLEQLADVIDGAHPDVVVVEEVARGWSLSGMTDEAEWFHRRLGMEYVWSPAADARFGNLVLSRLPVEDSQILTLERIDGTQDRSVAIVTVDPDGDATGPDVTIIGGHLQNGSEPPIHDERAVSYRKILGAWAGRERTVLVGDLNTYPREVPPGWPELDLVLDAGFATTQNTALCTMPTSNDNCPDWILTSPDLPPAPVRIVVDRPDHRPIAATVTLPGG
jgi:endonuclease/exonuclease/phosphatase family metal-dependent hydrolase